MVGLEVLPGEGIVNSGVEDCGEDVIGAENVVDTTGAFLAKAGIYFI